MKFKFIFCVNLCFCALFAQDYEKYFENLNRKNDIDFSTTKNPFTNPTFEKLRQMKIVSVMLDKVKIEDKWYELGDRIDRAVIAKINTKEITFKYENVEIVVGFAKNDKININ